MVVQAKSSCVRDTRKACGGRIQPGATPCTRPSPVGGVAFQPARSLCSRNKDDYQPNLGEGSAVAESASPVTASRIQYPTLKPCSSWTPSQCDAGCVTA